jgi:HSP20 family protein
MATSSWPRLDLASSIFNFLSLKGKDPMTNQNTSREIEPRQKQELETEGTRPGHAFRPDVDILEREDAFVIHADLPGVDEGSVDIRLDQGVLTLDARPTVETTESDAMHLEYRSGSYHRQFRISEKIDSAAVTGKMKDGVLELVLPKTAQHQPRRIEVQAA